MSRRYTITLDGRAITCETCGLTSHNRHDVEERYCGNCHVFHDDPADPAGKHISKPTAPGLLNRGKNR
jgi:hypothetical protein